MEALKDKKPEDVRAMSIPDLAKLFEGEAPTVEELKGIFQEGDVAAIAAALGMEATATVEDIVAAIQALVEKATGAAPEGEMSKEFKKAEGRIAVLESERRVREWEDRTREFKAIAGTPHEHAVKLAKIEEMAGKEAAEDQYAALKQANDVSAEALKVKGTSRTSGPTDFDNEVKKYQTEHKEASKADAIKAVSTARPDLWFARRQ